MKGHGVVLPPMPFLKTEVYNMARSPENKFVSKKHKARLQQEQQNRKMLIIASVIIVAIVLIVLAYGILDQTI